MSENLSVNSCGNLPVPGEAAEITISGGNNSFVAHADTVENNITVMINDPRSRRRENNARITFNTDFYQLFVILDEKFEDDYFLVPKDRALTESTNDELKAKYASLTPEAIEGLKRYPAIFADENHSYGKTDDDQDAYFGFVKDVIIQDNGSKNSPILPISTAFLTRTKPSKNNGFRAFRRMQLHIHNFTNRLYRVQIVHGFRNKNSRQGITTLSAVRLTSVRISTGATAITVYSPYTTTCYTYYTIHFLLCQSFSFLLL